MLIFNYLVAYFSNELSVNPMWCMANSDATLRPMMPTTIMTKSKEGCGLVCF